VVYIPAAQRQIGYVGAVAILNSKNVVCCENSLNDLNGFFDQSDLRNTKNRHAANFCQLYTVIYKKTCHSTYVHNCSSSWSIFTILFFRCWTQQYKLATKPNHTTP